MSGFLEDQFPGLFIGAIVMGVVVLIGFAAHETGESSGRLAVWNAAVDANAAHFEMSANGAVNYRWGPKQ